MAITSPGLMPVAIKSASHALHRIAVFSVGEAASARCVDQGSFLRIPPAGVEDDVVQKKIMRIRVELSAQHCGENCNGSRSWHEFYSRERR